MMVNHSSTPTSDMLIRIALKEKLYKSHEKDNKTIIIEELGITHGAARVDIAVINGMIHGYELKSDLDTLYRLSEQMKIYNSVLDRVTLVVGKNHLYEAINIIPEWWGVIIAKITDSINTVDFINIRDPDDNPSRDSISMAALLWRQEALNILESRNRAEGVRSKPRKIIYERLAKILDQDVLREKVVEHIFARINWRFEKRHIPGDG